MIPAASGQRWIPPGRPLGFYLAGCRLPWGPLEAAELPTSVTVLAARLGVDRAQVYRWRAYGVTVDQADELAARLNRHPAEVWPGWAT